MDKEFIIENIQLVRNNSIKINVSNRHIHLSKEDFQELFGKSYTLTPIKDLKQPGQYACKEVVSIKGPKGIIENLRVLGPLRENTQVEILRSDMFKLGINAPVRLSGDIENTPGIMAFNDKNIIKIKKGVIIAKRHIHMTEEQASVMNFKNGQEVMVKVSGERGMILYNVSLRVSNTCSLEMHIDVDEANACGIGNGTFGCIIAE